MKTGAFPLFLLLIASASCSAQDVPSYQAEAVRLYPDLSVSGSPMNRAFVALVQKERAAGDPEMQDPAWPMKIAQRVAGTLGVMPVAPHPPAPAPIEQAPAPSDPAPPPEAAQQKTITDHGAPFQATDIQAVYEANEVLADAKLKGRPLEVTGTIEKIGKDMEGAPYVQYAGNDAAIFSVQCMFGDNDLSALAAMRPGQQVTIVGVVEGKMMNVVLDNCSVVQPQSTDPLDRPQ